MDYERTLQFLIQSAASHDAALTRLEALAAQHEKRLDGHEERIQNIEKSMNAAGGLIGRLAQAQYLVVENRRSTDERLNILIDVVDRIIPRDKDKKNGPIN